MINRKKSAIGLLSFHAYFFNTVCITQNYINYWNGLLRKDAFFLWRSFMRCIFRPAVRMPFFSVTPTHKRLRVDTTGKQSQLKYATKKGELNTRPLYIYIIKLNLAFYASLSSHEIDSSKPHKHQEYYLSPLSHRRNSDSSGFLSNDLKTPYIVWIKIIPR